MTQRCRAWPEQEEGPYHLDVDADRHDVVEDRLGVPLDLGVQLVSSDGTTPVRGAVVEIWQCDALGRYSGFPPPDPPTEANVGSGTVGQPETSAEGCFLRGRQPTDDSGLCRFRTIYPGWYPGRTVHIHMRARRHDRIFTSQVYFPEDVTDAVFTLPPYAERPGRDTTNSTDEIFQAAGEVAVLDLEQQGDGYRAVICFVLPDAPR